MLDAVLCSQGAATSSRVGGRTAKPAIGIYPLLHGDTCRLLACDFDKATWRLDAGAYVEAATAAGVPTAVEISRSGEGAHVWTFFSAPVASSEARAMGAALLREAIALRGEMDLDSYDRFFPSQDTLPERGFGNLIALPLQGRCRRDRGTTVFVDPTTFAPWPDQFGYLASVPTMSPEAVRRTTTTLRPVVVGPEAPFRRPRSREEPPPPPVVEATLSGMLAIRRAGIPPALYATLEHLAVLHNPQFHKNENLRLSNHATPRFIRCYVEDLDHLYLPRGLRDAAERVVAEAGSRLRVQDVRPEPAALQLRFSGELRDGQTAAVAALAQHDLGVLEAPPGAGKTVMGCALIARHATPTLVLVDRKELLEQWRVQLRTHLGVEAGQIGAGRRRPTGVVDVAMLQTVTRDARTHELWGGYGLVVLDECHHVAAPTVERAVRNAPVRRWLGLTATPKRSDGLTEIMVMQCGPVRHRITARTKTFTRRLHIHRTALRLNASTDGLTRGEMLALVYAALTDDDVRTNQICADIARALREGRNCLVLSGRTDHVERLAEELRRRSLDPVVLHGGLGARERRSAHERLATDHQILLAATDRYIGEGFDCPPLDAIFLTFPISSTQRIVQYVGRVVREHPGKVLVEAHDYLDEHVPVLAAMHRRRLGGYRALGFSQKPSSSGQLPFAPPTPPSTISRSPAASPGRATPDPALVRVGTRSRARGRGPRKALRRSHVRLPQGARPGRSLNRAISRGGVSTTVAERPIPPHGLPRSSPVDIRPTAAQQMASAAAITAIAALAAAASSWSPRAACATSRNWAALARRALASVLVHGLERAVNASPRTAGAAATARRVAGHRGGQP